MQGIKFMAGKLPKIRLPWRVTNTWYKLTKLYLPFYWNLLINITAPRFHPKIVFLCGYHGQKGVTGVLQATADIANVLSSKYHIEFVSYAKSEFNRLLKKKVRIITDLNMNADLYICGTGADMEALKFLKQRGKKIIVTSHSSFEKCDMVERQMQRMVIADLVHFVSESQRDSYPDFIIGKSFVIPNMVQPIKKTIATSNVGVTGRLNVPSKNGKGSLALALKTRAKIIHLWGGKQEEFEDSRIISHGWEENKVKIYNTFDVLVNLSHFTQEACSLVVLEALSAGISCALSDYPSFQQFRGCPGVVLLDEEKEVNGFQEVNTLLKTNNRDKEKIKAWWRERYSEQAMARLWLERVGESF